MSRLNLAMAGRIRGSVSKWVQSRAHECVHCWQCGRAVTPWDSFCPNCGQGNPARLSTSLAVYLVAGFAVLAVAVSSVILAL